MPDAQSSMQSYTCICAYTYYSFLMPYMLYLALCEVTSFDTKRRDKRAFLFGYAHVAIVTRTAEQRERAL